jgi:hypothetical protein
LRIRYSFRIPVFHPCEVKDVMSGSVSRRWLQLFPPPASACRNPLLNSAQDKDDECLFLVSSSQGEKSVTAMLPSLGAAKKRGAASDRSLFSVCYCALISQKNCDARH